MSKITQRNTNRSTIGTWGSVSISSTDDVVVGSFATWTLTYTVGAYAMDVGGGLKIGTRRQADFGTPQFDDPAGDNYTTVTCSREGSRFETAFDPRGHKRPFNAVAVIRLAGRAALSRRCRHRRPGGSVPRLAWTPGAVLPGDRQ